MYLTYEVYQNMGGTLDETTFNSYEYEAETLVNWYTFNRLKNETEYPEELGRCMYRLIELVQLEAEALILGKSTTTYGEGTSAVTISVEPSIKSQSNDGVSVSYNSIDASDLFNKLDSMGKDSPLTKIIFRYLQGVRNSEGKRLTYRGLYPDE
jgi:hypothetical protein